ncbi:MAG: hypothetical protein SVS15_09015 [Thermodesulfobacteriota bacterium]|nr:hypothetical protein [Thermodesulfobacteriota bacterium]
MLTPWFRENVDLYFSGDYQPVYDQVMSSLTQRGIIFCQDGSLHTIVKP